MDQPEAPTASQRREGTQTDWPLIESLAAAMGDSVTGHRIGEPPASPVTARGSQGQPWRLIPAGR